MPLTPTVENSDSLLTTLSENETALRRFLLRKTGCRESAADIFQRIAEKLLTLDRQERPPPTAQLAYLYRTASNEAVSYHRQEERRQRYESADAELRGEHDERSAERIVSARDSLRVLDEALDELPLLTRDIFIQYRIDGLKQKDIARKLGLNLSTIEKHLAKAMKHCRQRLRDTEIYGTSPPPASKG